MRWSRPVLWGVVLIVGAFGFVCVSALAAGAHQRTGARAQSGARERAALEAAYVHAPLGFLTQQNPLGHPEFIARGSGYTLAITAASATLGLSGKGHHARVQMRLLGADPAAAARTSQRQPGRVNELLGSDHARWRVGLRTYARTRFSGVWPGIDATYYGHQQRLEYDFVLAPGADPARIALGFSGERSLQLDAAGDLELATAAGTVTELRPNAYQAIDGRRVSVAAAYIVRGSSVSLRLGRYDRARPLTIDPVLEYSTLIGGELSDEATGIAVDAAGDAYITGFTSSESFPTTKGSLLETKAVEEEGGKDAFVTAFMPNGAVRYSTFLGGTGGTAGSAIAIDGEGDAYVTGETFAEDFPTEKALQPKFGGGGGERAVSDAFASELSPDGSHLIYSTYLGGESSDEGTGISVDEAGDAFIAGTSASSNFPTDGGATFTTAPEAFVTEIKAGGARGYSRLLGALSEAHAIAVNGAGDAYVAGTTGPELNNSGEQQSAFVTKLNSSGGVSYSRDLGGGTEPKESGNGIAIDAAGDAYVAGGAVWLLPGPPPTGFGGGVSDALVAKLNPGGELGFARYLGGDEDDEAHAIALDSSGALYVTGFTSGFSTASNPLGFPVDDPVPGVSADGAPEEAYAAKLDGAGALLYSTPLGSDDERSEGNGIAVDAAGEAFVTGFAGSGFPTTTGPAYAGGLDAFVTRLGGKVSGLPCGGASDPCPPPTAEFVPGPGPAQYPPPSPPAGGPGAPPVGNYGPEAVIDERGTSTFVYHCSGVTSPNPCEGSMGYTGSGSAAIHYLVLAHFKVPAGKSVSVHLRLPKRTLAQLRRRHTLKLTLVISVRQGKLQTVRHETLKLKLARAHRR